MALDGDGRLVGPGDVVAQTRQVLDNVRRVLAAGGATLDDVVKVTVYLANVDDRPRVNEVRQAYFGANRPASTLVEVSRLAVPGPPRRDRGGRGRPPRHLSARILRAVSPLERGRVTPVHRVAWPPPGGLPGGAGDWPLP